MLFGVEGTDVKLFKVWWMPPTKRVDDALNASFEDTQGQNKPFMRIGVIMVEKAHGMTSETLGYSSLAGYILAG